VQLTGKQTQFLRALAHPLKPLVQVGGKGISDMLIQQISEQLLAHELIKVRFNTDSVDPAEVVDDVLERTKSQLVQKLGRTLILYRRREDGSKLELPGKARKAASSAPQRGGGKAVARSDRRRSKVGERRQEVSGRATRRAGKTTAVSTRPARPKRPERSVPGAKAAAGKPAAQRTRRRAPRPMEDDDG
jgi:RNA-binding protein